MLSQFTIQIMNYYILTRVYSATSSSLAVSLVWIAGSIPALIFGPFSGAIVDRFSRRHMLIFTNIGQGLIIASALLVQDHRIFTLYVIVFGYWALDQLYFPSQQASAPHLVKKELLASANGLFLLTQQVGIVVGFVLGGLLLSVFGGPFTIVFAAVAQFIAAIACFRLPHDVPQREDLEKTLFQFWTDLREGYHFVVGQKKIAMSLLVIIASQVIVSVVSTLMPAYGREILNIDLHVIGALLITPGVIGAISTVLLLGRIEKKYTHSSLVKFGLVIGSLSIIGMGLLSWIPSHLLKLALSIFMSICLGITFVLISVPSQTYLQKNTPKELLGRIYGQLGFLLILSTTVPLLTAATIADAIGIAPMLVLLGLVVLGGRYVMGNRIRV